MKASTALVALLPLVAATVDPAEILASMPECALECVVEGVADNGCSLTDLPCQCEKLTEMKTTMAPCLVRAGCDLGELTGTLSVVADACNELASQGEVVAEEEDGDGQQTVSSPDDEDAAAGLDASTRLFHITALAALVMSFAL